MSIGDDLDRRGRRGSERGADEIWTSGPVQAALHRKRIPLWVVPILAVLPVWALIYVGGLSEAADSAPSQLDQGAEIFRSSCSRCHGAAGEGDTGRPMTDSALQKTFPDLLGQLQFVWTGSDGVGPAGTPYGDPNREGGAHETLGFHQSKMPPFAGGLSQAQLLAVVRYEREVLSGVELDPNQVDTDGNLLWPDGSSMLDATGTLVTPDGQPLFDSDDMLTVPPDWERPVAGTG